MIEDLSVDKELEAQEKKDKEADATPEYVIKPSSSTSGPTDTGLPDGLATLLN